MAKFCVEFPFEIIRMLCLAVYMLPATAWYRYTIRITNKE